MTRDTGETGRPYHHGDLRRALMEAAIQAILEAGPGAVRLRDLARRAGVSHAAPAYHFGDKAGLLSAIAADGFLRLAVMLREAHEATGSYLEIGVAYVRFAVTNKAHFEVMFRPELYRQDDPEVVRARQATRALLYGPLAGAPEPGPDDLRTGVAAWSLVHGLATLWLNRNLPPQLGDDPEEITREVARYLFQPRDLRSHRSPQPSDR
jgi:AcrR family transcriptional regulator